MAIGLGRHIRLWLLPRYTLNQKQNVSSGKKNDPLPMITPHHGRLPRHKQCGGWFVDGEFPPLLDIESSLLQFVSNKKVCIHVLAMRVSSSKPWGCAACRRHRKGPTPIPKERILFTVSAGYGEISKLICTSTRRILAY